MSAGGRRASWALGSVVALAAIAVVVVLRRSGVPFASGDVQGMIARVRAFRHGRAAFVALYAVGTAFGVPVTPFTFAGGAVFGPWQGVALNWLGEMLGACLAFAVGRAARPVVQRIVRRDREASLEPVLRGGALALLRLRVVPIVPFALLNYGAALAGMRWGQFLAATAVGIVPVTVVYTVFAASAAAGVEGAGTHALVVALVSGAGILLLTLVPTLLRRRRASGR